MTHDEYECLTTSALTKYCINTAKMKCNSRQGYNAENNETKNTLKLF